MAVHTCNPSMQEKWGKEESLSHIRLPKTEKKLTNASEYDSELIHTTL